jgi:hypothetical protein
MVGLKRMIDTRGGFQEAKFPSSIQRLIAWAEISASNVLNEDIGILPLPTRSLDLPSYKCTATPRGPIAPTAACPDYLIDFSATSKSMEDIFTNLRFLSSVLELKHPSSIAQIDSMWYSDKVYLVQRDVVYSSLKNEHTGLDAACHVAVIIYIDSYMRDLGFHSGVVAIMVTRLKSIMDRMALEALIEGQDEDSWIVFFWVLVVGAIAAVSKPEQQWFLTRLSIFRERIGLEDIIEAENHLRKILWTKNWSGYLKEVWKTSESMSNSLT